jgi:hypothetical protein
MIFAFISKPQPIYSLYKPFAKLASREMNRRADKSLVKLYKDLMITRRDLIDLK